MPDQHCNEDRKKKERTNNYARQDVVNYYSLLLFEVVEVRETLAVVS